MSATTCIVTDSTAQFTQAAINARSQVHVIQLDIEYGGRLYENSADMKVQNLPLTPNGSGAPRLVVPSVDRLRQTFTTLGQKYQNLIGIFMSSQLSGLYDNALEAADSLRGRVNVQLIDSLTTSIGLGLLVQLAADTLSKGNPPGEIERLVRSQLPHVYTVMSVSSLPYLQSNGFIDHAQSLVGEILGLIPIFSLEEGSLTPLDKVKSMRHTLDIFQEFLDEFDHLSHIAFIQSYPASTAEARAMREHVNNNFPQTPFTEHGINLSVATLFGPYTIGLVAMESINHKR
jgi:DegV family protein with EDD domain